MRMLFYCKAETEFDCFLILSFLDFQGKIKFFSGNFDRVGNAPEEHSKSGVI